MQGIAKGIARLTLPRQPEWSVLPVALLIIVPLGVVMSAFLLPQTQVWQHLLEHVLPRVLLNTLVLAAGVGIGVLVLGISLAWLTAVCEFPGRAFFTWSLMLPMAMPAYVLAFVHVGLLDYSGPVQSWLRGIAGSSGWFPRVRSPAGLLVVLSLALYPYVYLLTRQAFATQGKRMLEAAQSLGMDHVRAFWKVALPMARPWWIAGLTLVLMETLADFATVSIFNFDTFTTAIYKAWLAMFSLPAASQLASLLVLLVLVLIVAEQKARGHRMYTTRLAPSDRIVLRGAMRWGACAWCGLVLVAGFAVPVLQIVLWTLDVWREDFDARYVEFVLHSFALAALAGLLVVALAVWLAYVRRHRSDAATRGLIRVATLGYAVPGMVLAVGIYIPVAWMDIQLLALQEWLGTGTQWVLKGTILVMLVGLVARFLAVGFQPIDAAMQRITRHQEEAARSLGLGFREVLARLHLPLLRGSLATAVLIVFVDVTKEIPITLMTRPFGWDTLAVRVFEMTSEGMWERAALPSLLIVLIGLAPVALLMRRTGP